MAAVDGLVSGINTTEMISQLMKVEALPQTALKNKASAQSKAMAAYQSTNTRFSSMLSAARAVTNPDTWGAVKATAGSDAVAVTAKPGSAAGSLSFSVDKLAAAHTVTFTGKTVGSLSEGSVLSGATLDVLKSDGSTETLAFTGDTSLQAVVKKINETEGAAYKAAAVQTSPGRYALQLTATTTGAGNPFVAATTPADPDGDGPLAAPSTHDPYAPAGLDLGGGTVTTLGTDAELTVGDPSLGFKVTSSSNTFTDVLAGVTITAAKKTDGPISVTLAPDSDGVAAKVQALVDNANVALSEITSQTKTKSETAAAGPLAGDSALRKLSQDILGAISGGAGDLGSLNTVGISVSRDGKVEFDKAKFLAALKEDPAKTRSYFDSYTEREHPNANADAFDAGWDNPLGIARKLENIGALASEGVILPTDPREKAREGLLTGLVNRRNDQIKSLNEQVERWDVRLDLRRTALQRQWSGLEVALGKLQSQSSWLAGQLSSLPSWS